MSDYKHGNWFCEPANESEAREIVERAVSSGAFLDESIGDLRWDDCDAWGVVNGRTYTGGTAHAGQSFYFAARYTIAELRQKFPLPSELASVESKSSYAKLQYPLGTPIEVRMNGIWYQATVHGQAGDYIIARADGYWYDEYAAKDVRQLRTEREKFVEDAIAIAGNIDAGLYVAIQAIYDALQSGELKSPEAE